MPQYGKSILEEQLKRGVEISGRWPWRLLLFMLIIFGLTAFVYAGMVVGYGPYLDSQIKTLDKNLADLDARVQSDQPKALINLYSQLVNLQSLLKTHPLPSKLLQFLEGNTDVNVYYTSLDFSLSNQTLKLGGLASDYGALSRQLAIFRTNPQVKGASLEDSRSGESGNIQFQVRLVISSDLLK